jgi:general secretion pathway protein N
MHRRWLLWFSGIFLIGLVALLPLRIAFGPFADQGFTARQLGGTVWHGRVGELAIRTHRLGTFDVAVDPLALLTGAVKLEFNRLDDPQGVLTGALVSGFRKGIRDTTGRVSAAGVFGPLPIEALELDDATILFRGNSCSRASGRITAVLAGAIPGLDGTGLSGTPRCEGERVRFVLGTPSTGGQIEFYVSSRGTYRGWIRVRPANPEASAALSSAGFRQSDDGMLLGVEGAL